MNFRRRSRSLGMGPRGTGTPTPVMVTITNAIKKDSPQTLLMHLKGQRQLYDLHTHLLGMGSASFWINDILMNEDVMPTDTTFRIKENENIRENLCPLIWNQIDDNSGFIDGKKTAEFFYFITENIVLPDKDLKDMGIGKINTFLPALKNLIKEEFCDKLLDRGLTFKKNFSYDVILTLTDLAKGLGVKETVCKSIIQSSITEKLGIYPPAKINFGEWIIFNEREQKFQIEYGIQVEELRNLIKYDPNAPMKSNELARAYIINAFSMCDPEGTPARHVDLHHFHGSFTPEFYPRRFALKDSIYSQRLDVLVILIAHIIERYQTSRPMVRYCEFSISVNDLSRPWVFDVLRSVRIYDQATKTQIEKHRENLIYISKKELSSFAQLVFQSHFAHLKVTFNGPEPDNNEPLDVPTFQVTYKFLAGFDRRRIVSSKFKDPDGALRFLLEYPEQAILLMIEQIVKSEKENTDSTTNVIEEDIFKDFTDKLDNLETVDSMPGFYDWVVGLDLFGDELGYPYCPFVARKFIKYINKRREIAKNTGSKNIFGVRIHCGENVTYADDNTQAYRIFIAHMYIVLRCLRFLQRELKCGIRIGHGIAFDRILGNSMSKLRYRKSSVLLAEIREHAKYLMKSIAFEVNITSNEYLLGQTLRQGDNTQPLRLDGLFGKIPIILATDDDGIWPITQCTYPHHPGHQSLAAEYCRAITSGLIKNLDQLKSVLRETKNFCFWNIGGTIPELLPEDALPIDDPLINTVIIHPDIIRRLLILCKGKQIENHPDLKKFAFNNINKCDVIEWKNEYGALRVAFICIFANYDTTDDNEKNEKELSEIRSYYYALFGDNTSEFDTIYDFWREVRSQLIFEKKNMENSSNSNFDRFVQLEQADKKPEVVYSPEPTKTVQSSHQQLINFISNFRFLGCTIHAYQNTINIADTIKFLKSLISNSDSRQAYKDMTLYLYTSTNEYTYVSPTLGKNFKLKINPHPSQRDTKKESFLYVLCPKAKAATAALHLLCDRIPLKSLEDGTDVLFGISTNERHTDQSISTPAPKEFSIHDLTAGINNKNNVSNLEFSGTTTTSQCESKKLPISN